MWFVPLVLLWHFWQYVVYKYNFHFQKSLFLSEKVIRLMWWVGYSNRMLYQICPYGGCWVTWWVVVTCKTNFSKKRGHCSPRCCSLPPPPKKKKAEPFTLSLQVNNTKFCKVDEKHHCWAVRKTVCGDTQTEKWQVWSGMKVHVEQ